MHFLCSRCFSMLSGQCCMQGIRKTKGKSFFFLCKTQTTLVILSLHAFRIPLTNLTPCALASSLFPPINLSLSATFIFFFSASLLCFFCLLSSSLCLVLFPLSHSHIYTNAHTLRLSSSRPGGVWGCGSMWKPSHRERLMCSSFEAICPKHAVSLHLDMCVCVRVCACICLRVNDQEWLRGMSVSVLRLH